MRLLESGLYPEGAWQRSLLNNGGFDIFSMAAGRV